MPFYLAEGVGFEPTWVAPNGFQDRLVMTASITLHNHECSSILPHMRRYVNKKAVIFQKTLEFSKIILLQSLDFFDNI